MAEHIKGPWDVTANDPELPNERSVLVSGPDCTEIAWMYEYRAEEVTLANARLIAAAPDLLAACQEFLPILERQLTSWGPEAMQSNAYKVAAKRVERMRAAIAKATEPTP